jgi:hypothetical protein
MVLKTFLLVYTQKNAAMHNERDIIQHHAVFNGKDLR